MKNIVTVDDINHKLQEVYSMGFEQGYAQSLKYAIEIVAKCKVLEQDLEEAHYQLADKYRPYENKLK